MIEVSEHNHAMNIEILTKWNIDDKVKFFRSDSETLGVIKGFSYFRETGVVFRVQDLYNDEELHVNPKACGKI